MAYAFDGSGVWQFGFTGTSGAAAAGEGWSDDRGLQVSVPVAGSALSTSLGGFKFALNLISNAPIVDSIGFIPQESSIDHTAGSVAINALGSVARTPNTFGYGWPVTDQVVLSMSPVPEPSTIVALLGIALMGIAILRVRPVQQVALCLEERTIVGRFLC